MIRGACLQGEGAIPGDGAGSSWKGKTTRAGNNTFPEGCPLVVAVFFLQDLSILVLVYRNNYSTLSGAVIRKSSFANVSKAGEIDKHVSGEKSGDNTY